MTVLTFTFTLCRGMDPLILKKKMYKLIKYSRFKLFIQLTKPRQSAFLEWFDFIDETKA